MSGPSEQVWVELPPMYGPMPYSKLTADYFPDLLDIVYDLYCRWCGARESKVDLSEVSTCDAGNCTVWSCELCGHSSSSAGPVNCPCGR